MILGLTGGIASGKTLLSDYFRSRGIPVVDADRISRELTMPGAEGAEVLRQLYGNAFFSGDAPDRKKIAALAFSCPEETARLNAALHPLIIRQLRRLLEENSSAPLCVLDAPLLFEAGLDALCDKTLAVLAPRETRISRAMARSGLSREEVIARIDRQQTDYPADFTIVNDRTPDHALRQADALLEKLLEEKA